MTLGRRKRASRRRIMGGSKQQRQREGHGTGIEETPNLIRPLAARSLDSKSSDVTPAIRRNRQLRSLVSTDLVDFLVVGVRIARTADIGRRWTRGAAPVG